MKVKFLTMTPNTLDILYLAARQCYMKGFVGDFLVHDGILNVKKDSFVTTDKKEELIKKVLKSGHMSVLRHASITFAIDGISRACSHQLVRHVTGIAYCLTGDTLIRKSNNKEISLKELYDKTKQYQMMTKLKSVNFDTKEFISNKIEEVIFSGIKSVYEIETKNGYKLKSTLEHIFFTDENKEIQLKNLKCGDKIVVNGIEAYKDKEWLYKKYYEENLRQYEIGDICGVSRHTIKNWLNKLNIPIKKMGYHCIGKIPPNKGKTKYDYEPMLKTSLKLLGNNNFGSQERENNSNWKNGKASYRSYKGIKNICEKCGKIVEKTHIHHIDHNRENNNLENLIELCHSCHRKMHPNAGAKKKYVITVDEIVSISYKGEENTYDICMKAPYHNFIANGIVVHNSQQSQRYAGKGDIEYITPSTILKNEQARKRFYEILETIENGYDELVSLGIPAEDARFLLSNATSTRIVCTFNFNAMINFLSERECTCAQWEVRNLAKMLHKICNEKFPIVFENAGPKCIKLKYCPEPEERSCGLRPLEEEVDKILLGAKNE